MDFEDCPHFEKRNGNMHPQRIVVICPGTPPKTNMRTKSNHLKMYLYILFKIVIFRCHVSFRGGKYYDFDIGSLQKRVAPLTKGGCSTKLIKSNHLAGTSDPQRKPENHPLEAGLDIWKLNRVCNTHVFSIVYLETSYIH